MSARRWWRQTVRTRKLPERAHLRADILGDQRRSVADRLGIVAIEQRDQSGHGDDANPERAQPAAIDQLSNVDDVCGHVTYPESAIARSGPLDPARFLGRWMKQFLGFDPPRQQALSVWWSRNVSSTLRFAASP